MKPLEQQHVVHCLVYAVIQKFSLMEGPCVRLSVLSQYTDTPVTDDPTSQPPTGPTSGERKIYRHCVAIAV